MFPIPPEHGQAVRIVLLWIVLLLAAEHVPASVAANPDYSYRVRPHGTGPLVVWMSSAARRLC